MDLTKLANEEIPIVVTTNVDVYSFVKGYQEYKSIWTPTIGEILSTEREAGKLFIGTVIFQSFEILLFIFDPSRNCIGWDSILFASIFIR